jgi:hypothetical protein
MSNPELDLEDDDEILEPARIVSVELVERDDAEDEDYPSVNYVTIELNDGNVCHFDAHKIVDLADFAKHM